MGIIKMGTQTCVSTHTIERKDIFEQRKWVKPIFPDICIIWAIFCRGSEKVTEQDFSTVLMPLINTNYGLK